MGAMSIFKRIASAFAPPRADPPADKLVEFLSGWQRSNTIQTSTYTRANQVQQFRGWGYVAIDARASESACLTPKVCRIVDGNEVDDEYRKSLYRAKSLEEREFVRQQRRRKYLSKSMRKKALAHVQDSDEMEQVSSKHDLVKLLQNPNGPDVAYTFFYRMFCYLRLTGVAYIWVVNNVLGKPMQLWCVPSHWVYEFPTDVLGRETNKLIGSYEFRPLNASPGMFGEAMGGWIGGATGKRRVDEYEVIKIAYVNPMSLTDAWSPMQATASWTDTSNAIDTTRVQTLYHGAYPGVVLQLDKEVINPDQPTLERIRDKFEEKVAGVRNFRKAYVLAPGLTIAPSPWQSSVELDHVNSATQIRDWQLAAHRTGPTIAGITEQTSFAADTAARQGFYHGTLRPDLMLVGQVLTEKLAPRFEDDLCVWYDDPTPDDPEFLLKKAETMDRLSANSPNEVREDFGDEPWEYGGDNPRGTMGVQELPWNTGEVSPMPGMDGGMMPGEEGGDPMDSVMSELMNGGNDGSDEGGKWTPGQSRSGQPKWTNTASGSVKYQAQAPNKESSGMPTPLGKSLLDRIEGELPNGNGKH